MIPAVTLQFEERLGQIFAQSFKRLRPPRTKEDRFLSDGSFLPALFFKKWFQVHGQCYFFLFKKNLKVTNIQFAELLALMRSHFTAAGGDPPLDLQFITASDFKQSLRKLIDAFTWTPENVQSQCKLVASLYSSLFRRLVVVDSFFGSCAVFTPPQLSLELKSICAFSGYVHSCGYNVFSRKVYKAKKKEFWKALRQHLRRHLEDGEKAFFAVYSHEDFTKYDRRWASELLDGLDNVKIFVEKYYMGAQPLVSVLREMQIEFKNKLVIPEAGDFRKKHKSLRKSRSIDTTRTIWLIVDHGTEEDLRHMGEARYFICFDQLYKNENPFHYFDENKPAWIAPTTIPHTLMGAMINITKPWRRQSKQFSIADPFVGSGTTWLEMLKYPGVSCQCGDLEPLVGLLAKDNLAFFSASTEELKSYLSALKDLSAVSSDSFLTSPDFIGEGEEPKDLAKSYDWARRCCERIFPPTEPGGYSTEEIVRDLSKGSRTGRLCFYIALRARLRHHLAFKRGSEEWALAYRTEAAKLRSQFKALIELRKEEVLGSGKDIILVLAGTYSSSCTLNPRRLSNVLQRGDLKRDIRVADARRLPRRTYDAIITDPPYGFNEEDDPARLARLYTEVIEVMINALKKDGQLVFAVPDWSYTGRRLSFFTHKEIITQQVLVTAEKAGREVFYSAIAVPRPGAMFRPPYYWESERALRRAILHFRLRSAMGWKRKRRVAET